jgi:hypothetical protein
MNALYKNTNDGSVTYLKEGYKTEYKYTIEYIDNKSDYDKLGKCNYERTDIYKTKTFDSMDDAITLFFTMYSRSDILDVVLFESLYINDELIQEKTIDRINYFGSIVNNITNKVNDDNRKLTENNAMLETEIETYKAFIEKYHAEKTYKQFKENNIISNIA